MELDILEGTDKSLLEGEIVAAFKLHSRGSVVYILMHTLSKGWYTGVGAAKRLSSASLGRRSLLLKVLLNEPGKVCTVYMVELKLHQLSIFLTVSVTLQVLL